MTEYNDIATLIPPSRFPDYIVLPYRIWITAEPVRIFVSCAGCGDSPCSGRSTGCPLPPPTKVTCGNDVGMTCGYIHEA